MVRRGRLGLVLALLAALIGLIGLVARRRRRAATAPPAHAGLRRLGGEDSGFLALELPEQPMNNLYLVQLGRDGGGPLTLGELRERFEQRLDRLPALRWRLAPVPYGMQHPMWVDDEGFDLDAHVTRVELPQGEGALADLCGRLAGAPLDRSRPLWDVALVDGLAGGRQAIVWRSHHCLMDGAATVTTLSRFFADDDELTGIEPTPFAPRPMPAAPELVAGAFAAWLETARRLPKLLVRTRRAWSQRLDHERTAERKAPAIPQDVPPCSLNDAFGPLRRITTAELELADFKRIREAAGVSFTDVALAAVAGGLRTILADAGDLPERPLVANCTVSFETPAAAAARQWGNRFSSIPTSLATDVADPWERLRRISAVTAVARRSNELIGEQLWEDWFTTLPPLLTAGVVRRHHARRREDRSVADANVTVSSVPGPRRPWRLGRFPVERVWLTGPPNNGVGLTVALFTYSDKVLVAVNSIEQSLKDPASFLAAAGAAVEELVASAGGRESQGTDR